MELEKDDKFQTNSTSCKSILQAATSLNVWCKDVRHALALKLFSKSIIGDLDSCLHEKIYKMWALFHECRTSSAYRLKWASFLKVTIDDYPALFYQYMTDSLFKILLRHKHMVYLTTTSTACPPLTFEEQNALRYVAGFVIRSVLQKYKNESAEASEETLFLYHLGGDDDDASGGTEDWVNLLDRGGLWHVNNSTYSLFLDIEQLLRQHLQNTPLQCYNSTVELNLSDKVCKCEDVLFQWSMLSAEIDYEKSMNILKRIVKLYITIRGHAFANSVIELYKQRKQRTLQKRKALRTELNK